mmetsp:Transcript_9336/g.25224  ORF Transcript_9336/g.25224 Transcript_9336/m.25224 type:complete len:222 (-) Transcript_9336:1437-2102(-)
MGARLLVRGSQDLAALLDVLVEWLVVGLGGQARDTVTTVGALGLLPPGGHDALEALVLGRRAGWPELLVDGHVLLGFELGPVGGVGSRRGLRGPGLLLGTRCLGRLGVGRLLLVLPVRSVGAIFGQVVHFVGADLDLDQVAIAWVGDDVQRLVAVLLRLLDVVLGLSDHLPGCLDGAERLVTVLTRAHDDPQPTHVLHLLGRVSLLLHLAPDAPQVLRPPG